MAIVVAVVLLARLLRSLAAAAAVDVSGRGRLALVSVLGLAAGCTWAWAGTGAFGPDHPGQVGDGRRAGRASLACRRSVPVRSAGGPGARGARTDRHEQE